MRAEDLESLRRLDRAPDGSCWYCKTVMKGHFEGCPVACIPRLLAEREALVDALSVARGVMDHAGGRFAGSIIARIDAALDLAES